MPHFVDKKTKPLYLQPHFGEVAHPDSYREVRATNSKSLNK